MSNPLIDPPKRKKRLQFTEDPVTMEQIPFIDSHENNTCPYGWLFNIATCVTSLCTLLVVIIFFIWAGIRGVNINN